MVGPAPARADIAQPQTPRAWLARLRERLTWVIQKLRGLRDRLIATIRGGNVQHDGSRSFDLACISDTGLHRGHNEDNFVFLGNSMPEEHQSLEAPLTARVAAEEAFVVGVFDGMGGELAGEGASYAAATCLGQLVQAPDVSEAGMAQAFRSMQDAVVGMRDSRRLSSTGSTAVVLACQGERAVVGNLGDSPAFLVRDGSLATLSVKHTDEQILRRLGVQRKPALTQYLGVEEQTAPIEPHVASLDLRPGDVIIIATDGLTDMVSEATIAREACDATNASALVTRLCELALDRGGADNVTILACRVAQPAGERRPRRRRAA